MTKTATLTTYAPFGTSSAIAIDLEYRGKLRQQITGPKSDKDRLLQTMRKWAKNQGYTHIRQFGETKKEVL